MAKIIKRTWTSPGATGRKVRHVAFGYTFMLGDKRERKFCSDWRTEDDALRALVARQDEIVAGRIERPADATLGALAEEYLKHKTNEGKRSLRNDRAALKKRLLPAFGPTLPVRALTETAIARYEQQRMAKVSAYTVANELSVLRHMLRLGRRWGYLDRMPEIEMPRKPEGRIRYLEEAEIEKLLMACADSRNPYLSAIVGVALNTGMRKEEVLGLTWERVNLAADFGLSAKVTLYKTKSGKPRGVPLNQDAVAALEAVEPDLAKRTGLVFKRGDGSRWGQVRTAFSTALTRAGIKGFRFHDTRHTFASHFMMRGGGLYDLKEILGHADVKMTMRYAHLSPHHLHASIAKVEGLARVPAMAHQMAQNGILRPKRLVSPRAPVAQVDRAAVS